MLLRKSLLVLTFVSIMIARVEAADLVLLDNTTGLTNTAFSNSSQAGWGSNTPAYNRINGYTFQVGSTSYNATAITIPLVNISGAITPNMRFSFWELPSLSATAPSANAAPFYIQNNASNTINTTTQYFTYSLTNGTLNLKANTRYSIGIMTDLTFNSGSLNWRGYTPVAPVPSGAYGLTTAGEPSSFFSTNGGATFSGSFSMNYGFQLTGVTAVPEPSTYLLGGLSAMALAFTRRRFRSRA